jgi:hypothetical protein
MATAHTIVGPKDLALETVVELAGTCCELRTNSSLLISTMNAIHHSLALVNSPCADSTSFSLQIEVDFEYETADMQAGDSARFRGNGHLVFTSLPEGVFVMDLLRRHITGRVTPRAAGDGEFWHHTLLPIALGVLGPSMRIAPLHCACLSGNAGGLLIAGVSGAGKSTLAAALAQLEFDIVSDDWTYIRQTANRLFACGLSAPVKLLPDAVNHFPQLCRETPRPSMNGEIAFQVSAGALQSRYASSCEPIALLFLERNVEPGFEIARVDGDSGREFFQRSAERLPHILAGPIRERNRLIECVAGLPSFLLRYSGPPQPAAHALRSWYKKEFHA